jgi:hypothetical protein
VPLPVFQLRPESDICRGAAEPVAPSHRALLVWLELVLLRFPRRTAPAEWANSWGNRPLSNSITAERMFNNVLVPWANEQQRAYNARYYGLHRESEIERVRSRQRAAGELLNGLRRVPCADCRRCFLSHMMDFDHRDPSTKSFALSGKVQLKSEETLLREVAKCDVICANCHRVRTQRQRASFSWSWPQGGDSPRLVAKTAIRLRQVELLKRLRSVPCLDCGESFPSFVMEFDHRDARMKRALVSHMAGRASDRRILQEVAKCDIVCSNCHRHRTSCGGSNARE